MKHSRLIFLGIALAANILISVPAIASGSPGNVRSDGNVWELRAKFLQSLEQLKYAESSVPAQSKIKLVSRSTDNKEGEFDGVSKTSSIPQLTDADLFETNRADDTKTQGRWSPVRAFKSPDAPQADTSDQAKSLRERLRSINVQRKRVDNSGTTGSIPLLSEGFPRTDGSGTTDDEGLLRLQRESMHFFGGGVEFRNRSGEEGLDKLFESRLPLEFNFDTGIGRIDIQTASVFLSSGELDSSPFVNRFYGTLALLGSSNRPTDVITDAAGQEVSIGYEVGGFNLRVGTTPLGFEVTNPTAEIGFNHAFNNGFNFGIDAFLEPVKDSLLSYSGLEDPVRQVKWGGVMKKGGTVGVGYDTGEFGVYLDVTAAIYEGETVQDNDFAQVNTGIYFYPYKGDKFSIASGFNLTAFGFENNMRFFTLGHGGYFSPELFLTGSIPLRMVYTEGKLSVKMDVGFGFQYFEEDAADFYPNNAALQQALITTEALQEEPQPTVFNKKSERQFGIRGSAEINYRLSERLSINGSLGFSNAADYEESNFILGLKYRFN